MLKTFEKLRERKSHCGLWHTIAYLLFTVCLENFGIQINREYQFKRSSTAARLPVRDGFVPTIARTLEDLSERDWAALRDYGGDDCEEEFTSQFEKGKSCVVVRTTDGDLASVCWYIRLAPDDVLVGDRPHGFVERCFTLPEFRGRGLYPYALEFICLSDDARLGPLSRRIGIECSWFNHSSRNGIRKAGFSPTRNRIELCGRQILCWAV